MPDPHTPLVATVSAGLVLAFALGLLANRLRISPLVGYLLAGVLVGPFTPGFVADATMAGELAEIGVILLMFAVGLHFSLADLLAVQRIAVPGAIVRIVLATLMGMGFAALLGWGLGAGLVFGLALSVASTVVLTRALSERRLLNTELGHIAVGWLVVEDLVMIVALVLLPALAEAAAGGPVSLAAIGLAIATTVLKVVAFVALMLVGGRRAIPALMHYVAHTGSRELFRLAVYAVALGVAYGAAGLFDVSFALGAFFAGMVLSESPLSQRAAEEALPLRDAFAVLFFVSVGMLFDPGVLVRAPAAVAGTVLIIVVGKSLVAWATVRAFGYRGGTALTVAASLAQIGEFSFILAGLGVTLNILPPEGRDLLLAGAILSILLNPILFTAAERRRAAFFAARQAPAPPGPEPVPEAAASLPVSGLTGHDVLVGYGRVGSLVGAGLRAAGRPLLVLDDNLEALEGAQREGAETVQGNAADPEVLAAANLPAAHRLFVTVPEAFEAGQVVEQARHLNPTMQIVARAHSEAAVEHLSRLGVTLAVMGEREIAHRMLEVAEGKEGGPASVGAEAGLPA